jgi:hypothetical protein
VRLQPIVLGILIAMAGVFVTASAPPPSTAPTTSEVSASERLAELSQEILKCASEVKQISEESRQQSLKLSVSHSQYCPVSLSNAKLPKRVVFRYWKTAYCKPCTDWKIDEKPRFEAAGITVVDDDTLEEDCTAPQFKLCWCPDGCECKEDCSNCTKCEVFSGFLSLEKLREISERCPEDPKKQPTPATNSATLKVASSQEEAKQNGAQIILGPGTYAERNLNDPEAPLTVKAYPQSSGSGGSSGTVSYSTASWVNASSYPVPTSSNASGGSYGGSVTYSYPAVSYQTSTYYQPATRPRAFMPRASRCRIVNGVRVCD